MPDIVARQQILDSPDLAVYIDRNEIDVVARASFNYSPDLNAYPTYIFPTTTLEVEDTPILISLGFATGGNQAFALTLHKQIYPTYGVEVGTAHALSFTITSPPATTVRRYLTGSQRIRHPRNRYPLGHRK